MWGTLRPCLKRLLFPLNSHNLIVTAPSPRRVFSLRKSLSGLKQVLHFQSIRSRDPDYSILFQSRKVEEILKSAAKLPSIDHRFNKMKCWVQIITTPTADTPGTTLLLHFDNKRYLIGNISEGTQRVAIQRKIGLHKLSDVFLTGTLGWGTAGGLLGLILTVADTRSKALEERKALEENKALSSAKKGRSKLVEADEKDAGLTIHGGRNLTHLLATSRRFVFRTGTRIQTNEYTVGRERKNVGWEPTWRDANIKVWAMVIEPEGDIPYTRKRSHDEFNDTVPTDPHAALETLEKQEDQYDMIRKSVVSSMFDSSWRLDEFVKKKLSDVQQPATTFRRNEDGYIERYNGPTAEEDPSVADLKVLVRNPWPGAQINSLPPTTPSKSSTSYIIKNYPQRGKFDPKKANELGVLKGPDFSRLTKGESVTTSSGRTVSPDMVLGQGKDGGGLAIVEIPSNLYVRPLLARKEWSSEEVMLGVGIVVWILGPGVIQDPELRSFMQKHNELKHIVSSKDCCANYLALESPATAAIRLNLLDPAHFPVPDFSNLVNKDAPQESEFYERAQCGLTIQLEPSLKIQSETIVPLLNTNLVVSETPEKVVLLAKAARKEVDDPKYLATLAQNQADIPSKDAEVITLGTGSSLPSKYRNVSATLIRVPGYGNYLLDCGENTLGQMKRVFGAELPDILQNLKVIWISHLHADHHLGTATVVKAWHEETRDNDKALKQNLVVASDEGMLNWLREYADIEDYGYDRLTPISMGNQKGFYFEPSADQTSQMGFSSIRTCVVDHCHGALAVVFSFPNGFKFAYSGDCRPTERFVKIGKNATLLIHEATFDDELYDDAVAKKHSTTSEALDIGRRMNARRILLTHFSQRYQNISTMNGNDGKAQVAIVAFDYMKIKIEDFAKIEAFKPSLLKLDEWKEELRALKKS